MHPAGSRLGAVRHVAGPLQTDGQSLQGFGTVWPEPQDATVGLRRAKVLSQPRVGDGRVELCSRVLGRNGQRLPARIQGPRGPSLMEVDKAQVNVRCWIGRIR